MAPARLTRQLDPIYLGATWRLPVQILDQAGDGTRTPVDLTDKTVSLSMNRRGLPDTQVEIEGTHEGDGLVLFTQDDEFEWDAGGYDVELTMDDGDDVLSLMVGQVAVVKGPHAEGNGINGLLPGAAQPSPGVIGIAIAATGTVQIVMVDRVALRLDEISIANVLGLEAALDAKAADQGLIDESVARTQGDTALNGRLVTAEQKLTGIADGATVNQADAYLLARGNHTGSQAIASITGLQGDLDAKAPLASPALTGIPTSPTPAPGTNSTQVANMAAVADAVQAIIGMSPSDLDTLAEIAARIQAGESNYAALVTVIGGKVAKSANLSDLADVAIARGNLELGSAALAAASAFQPADVDLTAIAALTTSGYGRSLLTLADEPAAKTALGLNSLNDEIRLAASGALPAETGRLVVLAATGTLTVPDGRSAGWRCTILTEAGVTATLGLGDNTLTGLPGGDTAVIPERQSVTLRASAANTLEIW